MKCPICHINIIQEFGFPFHYCEYHSSTLVFDTLNIISYSIELNDKFIIAPKTKSIIKDPGSFDEFNQASNALDFRINNHYILEGNKKLNKTILRPFLSNKALFDFLYSDDIYNIINRIIKLSPFI